MNNFKNNIYKFPRFLISVFLGFFLTTLKPIFKSSKKKYIIIKISIICLTVYTIYIVLKNMLGVY
uniref:Uncharacterized protein ycf33 n=1 Tax=Antithamnionella ternifolia TaxID=207919 RepID=A0A4D6WPD3_9FLOR|nr:hypothetical protein [Antithamnionella ternifolia]